ncbi:Frataxin [Calocera viscosa TUFC12733]|uniref:ferroxidase n=1 Tax=Calocera viscosa (strain TUFC12733) TaxID=1330018 RepID=A0A167QHC7_CALVF|nr:Frataxin [Calocera viscosa TUFC12733]
MASRSVSALLRRARPALRAARIAPSAAKYLHIPPAPLRIQRTLPPLPARRVQSTYHVATLTPDEYHRLSDTAMDNMLESLEEAIDAGVGGSAEEGWEVSYSSGVLTLSCGPHGTYVINKQPPNQQIWLSSPLSGPKRYDYSAPTASSPSSAAGDAGEEGGVWVYHRDGSTLKGLLEGELKEFAGEEVDVWVEQRGEGR